MSTIYNLAASPQDYKEARSFLLEDYPDLGRLSFPTIIARRDSRIVGVLSTRPSREAVIAGPMRIDVEGNRVFVLKNLVESYERILRMAGVTMYNFHADDSHYIETINEMAEFLHITMTGGQGDGRVWFRREL